MTDRRAVVTASLATLGVACLALPLSLFLLWYVPNGYAALLGAPSLTGWDAFRGLDAAFTLLGLLGAGAAAAGIVAGVRRNRPRIAGVAAAAGALCAVVALALVVRRIAEPPGGTVAQQATTGAWLGACCCVLAVLAAATAAIVAVRGPLTAPEPKAERKAGDPQIPDASDDVSVPAAVAPPPGNPRFPLVDGLRAIAVVAVVTGHCAVSAGAFGKDPIGLTLLQLGTIGVSLFFVISGFLLYRPFFAAQLSDRRAPRLRDYARRRVLRIVPAYWFALTILAIQPGLPGLFHIGWWRYYLLIHYYTPKYAAGGIFPAWSLVIEAAFYVVLPFIAIGIGYVVRHRTRDGAVNLALAILAALAVGSILLRAIGLYTSSFLLPRLVPTYFLWFALGMSLAVITVHTPSWLRRGVAWIRTHPSWCWAAIVVPYAILVLWGPTDPLNIGATESFVGYLLAPVIACLIALPAIFDAGAGVPRAFLALRPVAWVGLVSYGMFLWQFGVIQQFDEWGWNTWFGNGNGFIPFTLVVLLALCVVAAFSYYVIERPFLSLKDRRRRRPSTAPLAAEPSTR